MTERKRITSAAGLFLLALSGCHHAGKRVQQAAVLPAPAIAPVMVSVPPPTHHDQPEVVVETSPASAPVPEPTRRVARTTRRSSAGSAAPPSAAPPQTATITPPVKLGDLSAGGESTNGYKQQTAELLKIQQQRLDGISRVDAASHSTEIAQVKAFLQKATSSWDAADFEGAHTLVIKAKVLLDDLRR